MSRGGTLRAARSSESALMEHHGGVDIQQLKALGGHRLQIQLSDGSEHSGYVRTDLLSDQALSLFLDDGCDVGGGVTIYMHQICSVRQSA